MQITKKFPNAYFGAATIKEAIAKIIKEEEEGGGRKTCKIAKGLETTRHDDEREFYTDYKKMPDSATIGIDIRDKKNSINIEYIKGLHTSVSVEASNRGDIEDVIDLFDREYDNAIEKNLLPNKLFTIFIGHGGDPQWKDLKDHLENKHSYKIEAYETGARAGHTIRSILEEMSNKSSIAFLVMTGEDLKNNGTRTARPNVIHEVGLFQGKLGFDKAIVLLEEGTEEFSNLYGIQQIRFAKGNIKETYGDVLATIKRELEK